VATFFASIVAPGMTAPLESDTVPVIVPRSVCAIADAAKANKQILINKQRYFMSRFPPSGTEQLKFITKERHFGLRGGGGIPLLLARWAELYLSAFFPVVKKTSKMTPATEVWN
jgi:hypothetical protein